MKKAVVALVFVSAILVSCQNTPKKTAVVLLPSDQEQADLASRITEEDLRTHLYTYASDAFEGRETGTPGQKKAVAYLTSFYDSLGISMAQGTNNYIQKVPVTYTTAPEGSFTYGDQAFAIGEDFVTFSGHNNIFLKKN